MSFILQFSNRFKHRTILIRIARLLSYIWGAISAIAYWLISSLTRQIIRFNSPIFYPWALISQRTLLYNRILLSSWHYIINTSDTIAIATYLTVLLRLNILWIHSMEIRHPQWLLHVLAFMNWGLIAAHIVIGLRGIVPSRYIRGIRVIFGLDLFNVALIKLERSNRAISTNWWLSKTNLGWCCCRPIGLVSIKELYLVCVFYLNELYIRIWVWEADSSLRGGSSGRLRCLEDVIVVLSWASIVDILFGSNSKFWWWGVAAAIGDQIRVIEGVISS